MSTEPPRYIRAPRGSPDRFRSLADLSQKVLPILAFDPGGTTGWSLLTLHKDLISTQEMALERKVDWIHGQIDCHDQELGAYHICKLIDRYPSAAIVMEDFNIRQIAVDLAPVFLIGKVRQHLWANSRGWFMQSASQAKTTATDARLKLWGCYTSVGGLNHARDADRHALLFMRKCMGAKGIELRKKAWSHIYA